MSNRIRCACRRCTIRGLMGPAVIITVGVLFLLNETRGDNFSFDNTYPVILIVIGAISLAAAVASTEGHVSGAVPPPASGAPGSTPTVPQNQLPSQGQGQ
jgi:drug/metabolite transporter (DMT)-like permease